MLVNRGGRIKASCWAADAQQQPAATRKAAASVGSSTNANYAAEPGVEKHDILRFSKIPQSWA